MDYSKIMKFKGKWRDYQARVLSRSDHYLKDGRIHIVAAPGSGKTTIGIELIARLGEPALVLAPSITIREQWVARIKEGFLNEGVNAKEYLSQDLKDPRVITVVTYQALHSAMTRYKGTEKTEDTDDGTLSQQVDYTGFDVVKTMRDCRIKTLCLDECHHLRAEWWKALEDFKAAIGEVKVIALTATPPYDSTPAFWKRYMDMCGEIDEEVAIPELVKEGSLCPHQDFVYFNYPTGEETEELAGFYDRSGKMYEKLITDNEFEAAVRTHGSLCGKEEAFDGLLQNARYMSAFLVYLSMHGIQLPAGLSNGKTEKQKMTPELFEVLLQGFLYDDSSAYECEEYQKSLIEELKSQGLIEKKKVSLVANDSVQKLLTNSKGKCESIHDIVQSEYQNLGQDLRMLILTDYIRKEYEKAVGDESADLTALGVLPFFEQLRRSMPKELRLGVLCGTIVIIPAEAKEELLDAVGENTVHFSAIGSLPETDYLKVTAVGDSHFLTSAVTDIFTRGCMQVLIGTKSLLGEGWDSPCINSLILASFVGSFMLSNQMRGRAIRVFRDKPDKTSNIWHLVCLPPQGESGEGTAESEDYELLVRRMEHFLGLHYTQDVIESGIGRLSIINPPFDQNHVVQMNRQMLELSGKRQELKARWQRSLERTRTMEIAEETEVEASNVPAIVFNRMKGRLAATAAAFAVSLLSIPLLGGVGKIFSLLCLMYGLLAVFPKFLRNRRAPKRLHILADAVCRQLQRAGLLEDSSVRAAVRENKNRLSVYLQGGTSRDKEIFSQCIQEFFAPVDSPRYLLVSSGGIKGNGFCGSVPECFGKKKEDAQNFYECVRPVIGDCELVYTRSENGRRALLDARMRTAREDSRSSVTKKRLRMD